MPRFLWKIWNPCLASCPRRLVQRSALDTTTIAKRSALSLSLSVLCFYPSFHLTCVASRGMPPCIFREGEKSSATHQGVVLIWRLHWAGPGRGVTKCLLCSLQIFNRQKEDRLLNCERDRGKWKNQNNCVRHISMAPTRNRASTNYAASKLPPSLSWIFH